MAGNHRSSTALSAVNSMVRAQSGPLGPRPALETPMHMVVSDRKGRILHVTQALAASLGSSPKVRVLCMLCVLCCAWFCCAVFDVGFACRRGKQRA